MGVAIPAVELSRAPATPMGPVRTQPYGAWGVELSRAPATPMGQEALHPVLGAASPDDAVRVAQALVRAARRRRWRFLVAQRNGRLSGLLRRLRRDLGQRFAGRTRDGRTWTVRARDGDELVAAVTVEILPVRCEQDFVDPTRVAVLRPDLLQPAASRSR